MMHHETPPRTETSCILSLRRSLFVFVCRQDVMHDIVTRSPEKQVRKMAHSLCRNARNALCQPFLGPAGLSAAHV